MVARRIFPTALALGLGLHAAPGASAQNLTEPNAPAYQIDAAHSGHAHFSAQKFLPPYRITWKVPFGGTPSYPIIGDGRVFVTVLDLSHRYATKLYALDVGTGATVWGPIILPNAPDFVGLTYDSGHLFVLTQDGTLESLEGATGTRLWRRAVSVGESLSGPPTADHGKVFLSGPLGDIVAIDETTGATLWSQPVTFGDRSAPAVSANRVFVTYPCHVYSFGQQRGTSNWLYDSGCLGGGGTAPAYHDGRVVARQGVYGGSVFDAVSGQPLWTFTNVFSAPAIGPTVVVLPTFSGLEAHDIKSGNLVWTFQGDGQLVTSPIIVNNTVFDGSYSGQLYALDLESGAVRSSIDVGSPIQGSDEQSGRYLKGISAGNGIIVLCIENGLVAITASR